MCRLISFELQKIWCERSFLFSLCVLLILNVFFLRYTNLGGESTPEFSSYKRFQADIAEMSETEKKEYIEERKRNIDGVSFVGNILAMQNSEMGAVFAEQEISFSSRNVQKSAVDYANLTTEGIRWTPSKAIASTVESTWTDIFLILLSFLFIGSLITEEKQKGLVINSYYKSCACYFIGVLRVDRL